ncbi:MAG: hypothetical protein GC164_02435 [Phycisphaera sp.]|nr:hypothetical protein [Phycisphaera sp.]
MKRNLLIPTLGLALAFTAVAVAQDAPGPAGDAAEQSPVIPSEVKPDTSFDSVTLSIKQQLEKSIKDLEELSRKKNDDLLPRSQELSKLEAELISVRQEYQQADRLLVSRTLDKGNLNSQIKSRQEEATYLSNLISEYIRNFEAGLHISELQRFQNAVDEAKLAAENESLTAQEVFAQQVKLLTTSLDRLEDALGGTRFDGKAVDSTGLVTDGTFVLIGPSAIFRAKDGHAIGSAEQRLGSLEPNVIPYEKPEDTQAADALVQGSGKTFPFDPSLGNAHVIASTKDTLMQHIKKGGPVMIPIFILAGIALLVALFKLITMSLVRSPSNRRIEEFIAAVARKDAGGALQKAKAMSGPTGKMLTVGAEHIKEPKDLIEEVMYEQVLSTRLSLNRFLPMIAITSSAAPLFGLLGTVTGIMNTFTLITVFGTGDVKTLSSGISEALITTEYGLMVAIPSLLIYAFLSRRAKSIVDQMEKAAIAYLNQLTKTPMAEMEKAA